MPKIKVYLVEERIDDEVFLVRTVELKADKKEFIIDNLEAVQTEAIHMIRKINPESEYEFEFKQVKIKIKEKYRVDLAMPFCSCKCFFYNSKTHTKKNKWCNHLELASGIKAAKTAENKFPDVYA